VVHTCRRLSFTRMCCIRVRIREYSLAYNADTGDRPYQERLGGKGGAFTASPIASDGKLYLMSEDGDVFVVKTRGQVRVAFNQSGWPK